MAEFKIDLSNERLWDGDRPVQIGNKAFQLLRFFVSNPNQLLTKDKILSVVWQDVFVSEGLIKEYVHDLREALDDDPKQPRFIETVRGRGYRFLGGIESIERRMKSGPEGSSLAHALSLVVLPFNNLSDDREQEYFADGICEDIIIGLSKNPHLSVISRNSSFAFKGKTYPAQEIGRNLGAQFILEGSVRRAGRRIRITAELMDSRSDRHMWGEAYDRDLDDIFAVQDEVVSSIIHALGAIDGVIERAAEKRIAETPDTRLSAYDCYLRAQGYYYRHGDSGYDEAEALYQRAIELDPEFARAHSALAFLHFQRFKKYLTVPFDSIERKTQQLALRAVQLDADDYLAHWVLGRLYSYLGKRARSLAKFNRALQINPNDANLLADFADFLVYYDRTEDALKLCQRAIRLNPKCPDWYWWNLGFSYFHLGLYEDALESLEQMTTPGPARRLLAATYAHLGRLDEAHSEAAEFIKIAPSFSIGEWAKTEPYTEPNELERYVSGLRMAGLPG